MARDFQATIERADKTFDWVVQHAGTGGIARRTIPSIQCVQRGTIIEVSPLKVEINREWGITDDPIVDR